MTDEGGDPACWLERVCEECGAVVDEREPHVCRDQRGSRSDLPD